MINKFNNKWLIMLDKQMKQLLFRLFNKLNKHLDFLIKEFHQIEDIESCMQY